LVLLSLLSRSKRVRATDHRLDGAVELVDSDPLAEPGTPHRSILGLGSGLGDGFTLSELFRRRRSSSMLGRWQRYGEDEELDEEEEHAGEEWKVHGASVIWRDSVPGGRSVGRLRAVGSLLSTE